MAAGTYPRLLKATVAVNDANTEATVDTTWESYVGSTRYEASFEHVYTLSSVVNPYDLTFDGLQDMSDYVEGLGNTIPNTDPESFFPDLA